MTSIVYSFTIIVKPVVKIIFGHTILLFQPIYNIFVALFTTFGMQKDGKIAFSRRCLKTR